MATDIRRSSSSPLFKIATGALIVIILWVLMGGSEGQPVRRPKGTATDLFASRLPSQQELNTAEGTGLLGDESLSTPHDGEKGGVQHVGMRPDSVPWYKKSPFKKPEYQKPESIQSEGPKKPGSKKPNSEKPGSKRPDPKTWDLASFKSAWLETELGGDFNGSFLQHKCAETEWRTDLAIHLQHSRGGIANVRGTILDYFNFAIHAGISHVVAPTYVRRSDSSLNWMDDSGGYWPFGNMFDEDFLFDTFAAHCPQMKLYRNVSDVPYDVAIDQEYQMQRCRSDKAQGETIAAMTAHLASWVRTSATGYDAGSLNLVGVGASLWQFDLLPNPRLRAALGRMCKINPSIRALAAAATYNLRAAGGLEAQMDDPRAHVYRGAFYGMHLRTEQDAAKLTDWMARFGGFEAQSAWHLDKCEGLGLRVIYVASGNRDDIKRLAALAKDKGILVLSKTDLITDEADMAVLDSLTWDQQGALDWEVLSRSTYFSGPYMASSSPSSDSDPRRVGSKADDGAQQSSFAWNIAYRRHLYIKDDERLNTANPFGVQEEVSLLAFEDGLSSIMLRTNTDGIEYLAPRGMFP